MKKTLSILLSLLMVVSMFSLCSFAAGNTLNVGANNITGDGVFDFTAPTSGVYTFCISPADEEADCWWSFEFSREDVPEAFCYDPFVTFYYLEAGESCSIEFGTESATSVINVTSYGEVTNVGIDETKGALQNNYDVVLSENFVNEGTFDYSFQYCVKIELNGESYLISEVEIPQNDVTLVSGSNNVTFDILGGSFNVTFDLINVTDYIESITLPEDFSPVAVMDSDGWIDTYELPVPETITANLVGGGTTTLTYDEEYELYRFTAGTKEVWLFPSYYDDDGKAYFHILDGYGDGAKELAALEIQVQQSGDVKADEYDITYAPFFTDIFGLSENAAKFLSKVLTVLINAWFGGIIDLV